MSEEMKAKGLGAAVITLIGYLSGIAWGLFLVLVVMMTIDYGTGILKAVIKKKLESRIGRDGLIRKTYILILVGAVILVEYAIRFMNPGLPGLSYGFLSVPVMSWYIFLEFISILENGIQMGAPVPPFIKDVLAKFQPKEVNSNVGQGK